MKRANRPIHVTALWPNYYDETWVSYTLKSIMRGLQEAGASIDIYSFANRRGPLKLRPRPLVPGWALKYAGHWVRAPMRLLSKRAAWKSRSGDVAYLWLNSDPEHVERLQRKGVVVVREMINCTVAFRREALGRAFSRMNLGLPEIISDEDIERERASLLCLDAVFCPNPFVYASVRAYGVPADRCIRTSYGWDAERLARGPQRPFGLPIRFLFVGTVDVRKGAPELLEAWALAGVEGTLTIAGNLSEFVAVRYATILRRPDVRLMGHVSDVSALYADADVFVLPSWEEGGPQVTLEAMACGVVPVTTAIGTAGAFTDGEEVGFIIEPGDVRGLADILIHCSANRARIAAMSDAAHRRAQLFEWSEVGRARLTALGHVIPKLSTEESNA